MSDLIILNVKCTRVSEPMVSRETDLADYVLCDFATESGGFIKDYKVHITPKYPCPYKEGCCYVAVGDLRLYGIGLKE